MSNGSEMGLIEKIKKVMLSPSEFFEAVKYEDGIVSAFKYLAILSLVSLFVELVVFFLNINFNLGVVSPVFVNYITKLGIGTSIGSYILVLILSFVGAGLIHLFIKLLKGVGDYSATYRATIYSMTPSLLFGWIPLVGPIIGFYSLYLGVIGISKIHEMSVFRAIMAVFVIPAVITIILALLAYMYISSLTVGV